VGKEAVQTLEDWGGRVGCNHEESAEGWVEDMWVEVFVEAEAKGGAAADQSHGQDKVGCGTELRAQKAKATSRDAKLRD
jgi:hypothetical protein